MKSLTQHVNIFQTMLALSFCLLSVVEMRGMDSVDPSSCICKRLERTYDTDSSRDSSKVINIPYDLKTNKIDGNVFASKIYEGLTPQERLVSMVLRGYPHGEEVVLHKSEIQANPVRSFSLQEITEMKHLRVVVFLDELNK